MDSFFLEAESHHEDWPNLILHCEWDKHSGGDADGWSSGARPV